MNMAIDEPYHLILKHQFNFDFHGLRLACDAYGYSCILHRFLKHASHAKNKGVQVWGEFGVSDE